MGGGWGEGGQTTKIEPTNIVNMLADLINLVNILADLSDFICEGRRYSASQVVTCEISDLWQCCVAV